MYIQEHTMNWGFEWDEGKNQANFKKHWVWFEEARTLWNDPRAFEVFDLTHSEHEDRFARLGISTRGRLLMVFFCEKRPKAVIRIISARKASYEEEREYEKRIRL